MKRGKRILNLGQRLRQSVRKMYQIYQESLIIKGHIGKMKTNC